MAKNYFEIDSENQKIFDSIFIKTMLDNYIDVGIFGDNDQKEIFKLVKENDLHKFLTKFDVVFLINEEIFDNLDTNQKEMIFEEMLAGISYNSEKDKLVINKPDFVSHSAFLEKYTFQDVKKLKEIIKLALQQKEDSK